MTFAEFNVWLNEAQDMFPQVAGQLKKTASRESLSESWFRIMERVPAWDASDILRKMLAGTAPEPGRFDWHTLPRHVAKLSRQRRDAEAPVGSRAAKFLNGEQVYECPICRDYGLVTIWSPVSMSLAQQGLLHHPGPGQYHVTVLCACRSHLAGGDLYFRPEHMVRINPALDGADQLAELYEFLGAAEEAVP